MKRTALWIVGAGVASVALMLALRAQERQASTPAPAASPSSESAAEENVIFTFSDEDQMRQFAQLWQQRQNAMTRMTVLQSYWNDEQASLGQLNQQLLSQYKVDAGQNHAYTLDPDRKVLIERPAPAGAAAQPGETPSLPTTTPIPSTTP